MRCGRRWASARAAAHEPRHFRPIGAMAGLRLSSPAMKLLGRALVFVALCAGAVALPLFAQAPKPDSAGRAPAAKDSTAIKLTAQQERGAKAYLAYCSMCHGEHGAGDGPVAEELARREGVRPAHLDDAARLEKVGARGVREVIVRGGAHTGRSNLMPTWGEHLAPAVVDEIVAYVMVLPKLNPGIPPATVAKYMAAPAGTPAEGRKLFVTFCTACHGPQGKGDGFNADSLYARNKIRPRNLTETSYFAKKTDQDLYATIALGGGHTGKSTFMPGWTYRLEPAQIKDLVSYVRAISKTKSRP